MDRHRGDDADKRETSKETAKEADKEEQTEESSLSILGSTYVVVVQVKGQPTMAILRTTTKCGDSFFDISE